MRFHESEDWLDRFFYKDDEKVVVIVDADHAIKLVMAILKVMYLKVYCSFNKFKSFIKLSHDGECVRIKCTHWKHFTLSFLLYIKMN